MQGTTMTVRSIEKGSQSYVENATTITARTAEEWAAAWKRHAPDRPLPPVDFSREMVLGVFTGTRTSAGYSVEIVSVDKQADGVVVRYRETRPGRGAVAAQIITSPYHFVAVPKEQGGVRFEKTE